jgi:hypothetical protein
VMASVTRATAAATATVKRVRSMSGRSVTAGPG